MWQVAISIVTTLLVCWALFVLLLWRSKPSDLTLRNLLRLLPDIVRLAARLVRRRDVPLSARVALVLLLGYLASPIDLVPDFVPVLGFADDAVMVALTLRWVIRRAGVAAVRSAWPGRPDGLATVLRAAGLAT